jgi:hypothetical protein
MIRLPITVFYFIFQAPLCAAVGPSLPLDYHDAGIDECMLMLLSTPLMCAGREGQGSSRRGPDGGACEGRTRTNELSNHNCEHECTRTLAVHVHTQILMV